MTKVLILAVMCAFPLLGGEDERLMAEFQKTKPSVTELFVLAETPLLVAVTGPQGKSKTSARWDRDELLGVFAHRDAELIPISVLPNEESVASVSILAQTADSIALALAADSGLRSANIEIFFDPKTYFPKRIVRYAPVRLVRVAAALGRGGSATVLGTDGIHDLTAVERNGAWQVSASDAAPVIVAAAAASAGEIAPMPVSTVGEFEQARPTRARQLAEARIGEEIGPSQRVANKLWGGKTFVDSDATTGVGDVGYFDEATHAWSFLHIPELADWSVSALLVDPDAIWVGRARRGEGAAESGGLLRYDRASHIATLIAVPDVIEKIVHAGQRIYCGTAGGFTIVEQSRPRSFQFVAQPDGKYVLAPVL